MEYQPNEIKLCVDYAEYLIAQKDYKLALTKMQNAYKLDSNNIECLNVLFYLNYLLAKENLYDYNIEKAMKFAKEIEEKDPDSFSYAKEKEELVLLLNNKNQERQCK